MAMNRKYWKGIDELSESPKFIESGEQEFSSETSVFLQSSPAVAVHAYSNFPRQGDCIDAASARLVETTSSLSQRKALLANSDRGAVPPRTERYFSGKRGSTSIHG